MLIVRLGITLMLFAAISAGGLAMLNGKTAPIIKEYKLQQQIEARKQVASEVNATQFEEVIKDGFTYFRAKDDAGNLVGYAVVAYGPGYSSTIETVCGFDLDFKVAGLKIIFQQETPGLGTKAEEVKKGDLDPWFLRQYKGKDATSVAVVQDRGNIDSITGATITSRAITNSIKDVAMKIKEIEAESAAAALTDTAPDSTAQTAEGGVQ